MQRSQLLMADPAGCSSGGGAGMMDEAAQAAAAAMYAPHLRAFWEEQNREIAAVGRDPAEFKNHQLPLARIKKVLLKHVVAWVTWPSVLTESPVHAYTGVVCDRDHLPLLRRR